MKNELSCEVVQDLLPSYLDGLTSEVTNEAVAFHLKQCEVCTAVKERMEVPDICEETQQETDIDYLKKMRKKTKQRIAICVAASIAAVMAAVIISVFFIGKPLKNPELIQADVSVTNRQVKLTGQLKDAAKGVSDIRFENKDGIVTISLSQTQKSVFHANTFSAAYESEDVITQVWLGDRVLWDGGESIDEEVSDLYQTRHQYVGDMVANGQTASVLGIANDIGNFKNELQTEAEPYGWTLNMEQGYAEEMTTKIETQMRAYGCMLIALIDNLSEVTYHYSVEGIDNTLTVTEADADALVGRSVKGLSQTPFGLQQLMKILNLTQGYIEPEFEEYTRNSDGTWKCGNRTYKYRLVLTGRENNAVADGHFVVLTNNPDVTFKEVSWSMFSSSSDDWLDSEETVIVSLW